MDSLGWRRHGYGLALAVVVMAGAAGLMFSHLGREPLWDYDEATYAEVTREALTHHAFISLTYLDHPFFKKPPLYFWLAGASEAVVPDIEAAVRLPSALAGIATVCVVLLFILELTGNWYAAALGAAALATMGPFVETARQARLDVLVALFITAAGYALVRGLSSPRWLITAGVFAGLAVLAKSVIAVFAGVFCLAFLLALRRLDVLKTQGFLLGSVAFALVALPWHLWEWARFGGTFWQSYLGTEVVGRVQHNLFDTASVTNSQYLWFLSQYFVPWLWLVLAGMALVPLWAPRLSPRARAAALASLVTVFAVLLVCFTAATKAPTYFTPLYPFAALFLGLGFDALWAMRRVRILTSALAVVIVASAARSAIPIAYHLDPNYAPRAVLAQEEKTVAEALRADPHPTFYAYGKPPLGSIMFYSRKFHPLALIKSDTPHAGELVVTRTFATSTLMREYPSLKLQAVYTGSTLALYRSRS